MKKRYRWELVGIGSGILFFLNLNSVGLAAALTSAISLWVIALFIAYFDQD